MQNKAASEASKSQDIVLIVIDRQELARLERIVDNGMAEVGLALKQIRDKRLYREKFKSFEAYCQSKWGFTRVRGHQLIQIGNVVEALPEKCKALLNSPRAATELGKAPVRQREGILAAVAKHGKVTAEEIKRQVRKLPALPGNAGQLDKTGTLIPRETIENWDQTSAEGPGTIRDALKQLRFIKRLIQKVHDQNRLSCSEIFKTTQQDTCSLSQVIANVERAVPYAVCWVCSGKHPSDCETCGGRGFVSEFFWKTCCPEEIRKLRTPQ